MVVAWLVLVTSFGCGILLYVLILKKVWQRGLNVPINFMIVVEETILMVEYSCWHGVILPVLAVEKPLVNYTVGNFSQS